VPALTADSVSAPDHRPDATQLLTSMLSSRSPGAWGPELAAAVLPIFAVDPDGLARPRLPFDTHMQIVDTLLDYDAGGTLMQVRAPTWLVSCEPLGEPDDYTAHKTKGLQQLAALLPQARVLRWLGAVHDVPLQWPALVAGLVRAAAEDAATAGRPET
jgi:pimeloyl-ACP methyl ester carboxylesterase